MFLRNAWYVGAWDHEVQDKPMARIILNEPIVFYRTEDGVVRAMEDRCPHRRLPLSMGKVVGQELQCHYHGMRYNTDGQCVFAPGGQKPPPQAKVRTYPVVERNHWIWIWMGDPALADPDKIEDFHWLDDPEWGAKGTVFHVDADYKLIIENLLDLTHLTYVHDTTIGNDATANAAQMEVEHDKRSVTVTRWMIDQPAPPTYQKAGNFKGNIDRWQIITWTPPAFVRLYVGGTETGTGAPEGNRVGGIGMRNLNAITPETETTTHYFWAQAHDFEPDNAEITDFVYQQVKTAFLQDVDVFEAQQQSMEAAPDAPQVNLETDKGGLLAFRILDRLIREEEAPRAAAE